MTAMHTDDLDVIGKYTEHVTGRSSAAGGSGDSARPTALGVFNAMRAGAESIWGTASLAGRTVGDAGIGNGAAANRFAEQRLDGAI